MENLLTSPGTSGEREIFQTLRESAHFRLERIVSTGQATPPGEWLEQEDGEWVALLQGEARLRFQDEEREIRMAPGDHLWIAPRRRHRVEWTPADRETVWLALHTSAGSV